MKRILIFIILSLIFINGFSQVNQVDVKKLNVRNWIIYQGDTLAIVRVSGDTLFVTRGETSLDTMIATTYWTKTGNDIANNNTGKVILPKDSTYFYGIPDEATKVGRIAHINQFGKIEWVSPSTLGDTIAYSGGGVWFEDNDSITTVKEHKKINLNWPDSIMYEASNTGADYTISHTYEAFKFVADKDYPLGTLGPIDLYLKKDGTITNVTGALQKYIYSDNAGVPGTALTSITVPEMYGNISTSYTPYPSQNGSPALTSGTAYWLVLVRSAAASGGNVYVDCANTGTAFAAYSSDGSSWTPVNNYTAKYRIHYQGDYTLELDASHNHAINTYSQTSYGIEATSVYDPGVRGVSTNAEGMQGNSTYGVGVQGNSTHNIGVQGLSTNYLGGGFNSTNYYGMVGITSKSGYAGVWGQGTVTGARGGFFESVTSYGVVAGSTSGEAVYGYTTTGIPLYLYKNPSTTNASSAMMKLEIGSSGTPAAGIGSTIDWYNENSAGAGVNMASIGGVSQKVTSGSERGALQFYTKGSDGLVSRAQIDSNGYFSVTSQKGYAIAGTSSQSGYAGIYGIGSVSGSRGGYFQSTNSYGIVCESSSGNAIYGFAATAPPLYIYKSGGTNNAISNLFRLETGCTGTAAAGLGGSIEFYLERSDGGGDRYAGIASVAQNATVGNLGGKLSFYTYSTTGGYTEKVSIDSAGIVTVTNQITSDNSFGELWDNAGTVIATVSTAYRTVTSLQAGDYNEVTLGDSSMTITQAGTYLVNISTSFTHSVNNTLVHISLFENDVHDDSIEAERKIGTAGDYGSASASGLVVVAANAVMKLRATSDNNGNTTFSHINFTMTRIK